MGALHKYRQYPVHYWFENVFEALKLAHHRISPGSQQNIKEPMV